MEVELPAHECQETYCHCPLTVFFHFACCFVALFRSLYESQLALVRKNRDEAANEVTRLEAENSRMATALRELEISHGQEKKLRTELQKQVEQLTRDLTAATAQLTTAQSKNKQLAGELSVATAGRKDAEAALKEYQERADSSIGKLAKSEARLNDLNDDYKLLQARHREEVERLQQQIHRLCEETGKNEDTIRAELEQRMNALFAERQQVYEQEKAEAIAQLKLAYDEKLLGYRSTLESVGHELEQEKVNHRRIHALYNTAQQELAEYESDHAALTQRIEQLESALQAEKANPELLRVIQEKQAIIQRIKASFKRKDAEFDELMDVKIMLDMEIKAYRNLLEGEELRLGMAEPAKKKRKRNNSEQESVTTTTTITSTIVESSHGGEDEDMKTVELNERTEDAEENEEGEEDEDAGELNPATATALLIRGMDLEGQYITIRNNSTEVVNTAGWKLKSKLTQATFSFPALPLRAGESFVVSMPNGNTVTEEENHIARDAQNVYKTAEGDSVTVYGNAGKGRLAYWQGVNVWHAGGDEAQLYNPWQQLVARVEVIPSSTNYTGTGEDGNGNEQDKKQCIVM